MRITRKATLAVGVGSVAAAALLTSMAGVANADPTSTPPANSIVAVGSDTTQALFNQFSTDYNASSPTPTQKLYSFDATGTTPITTKTGCTSITRPNGSGAGIKELQKNQKTSDNANYCVDIARSSRGRTSADTGVSFVAFAQDAVTWSKTNRSGAPSNAPTALSIAQLKAIYSCDASLLNLTPARSGPVTWDEVGGTGTAAVLPVLPQASSGTRSFFLGAIGVTNPGTCVSPTTPEENEGTDAIFSSSSSPNIVFPYSVAVYLAQSQNGHGTGQQGNQVLGSVKNTSGTAISPTTGSAGALTINGALTTVGLTRSVYAVVRDSGTSTHVPTYLQPLLGNANNQGWICKSTVAQADITSYGFKNISTCGTVS